MDRDGYRPPRERRSTLFAWISLWAGVSVLAGGLLFLIARAILWALR